MGAPEATRLVIDADLARLAAAYGVAVEYEDQLRRPVVVAAASVAAVLGALGVDASSPDAVRVALADIERRPATPPAVVLRQSVGARVPVGAGAAALVLEDGSVRDVPVVGSAGAGSAGVGSAGAGSAGVGSAVALPPGLPLGWHELRAGGRRTPVVVAPDRLPARTRREWGWMVQLYATRSRESWGVGDLGDLAALARWTGERGGGVVLVNPLHAAGPVPPMQPSPYFPASRRWANPVYLRVEQTEWYGEAPAAVRAQVDALRPPVDPGRIDRDTVWAAKLAALGLLWRHARDRMPQRCALPPEGDDLWTYATWCALCEVHGNDWRTWPEQLRSPSALAVGRARVDLDDRVRFHAWLQVLCADQLERSQSVARDAGMDVGIVHDLAVGTDPAGADAWALQDVLALGARIGAPPDTFNQQGQDWGMPPWHPRRLAEAGYAPLRDMLRSLLRHAGGVRIDHILGMFRLWWIPEGRTAREGTYVAYDADALLGVIALEAERAGAVVVGEDLGTVTPQVRRTLRERGVLGSSVLWFERDEAPPGQTGPLTPPTGWREAAMASVTTHDLPTALGWWRGEHVRVRADLGLLDDPAAEEASWRAERAELTAYLRKAGLLGDGEPTDDEWLRALHLVLARTPSRYVVVAPGDAVGDLRQPNLPGTVDEYPNWRLPVADSTGRPMTLEELLADPRVGRLAHDLDTALHDLSERQPPLTG